MDLTRELLTLAEGHERIPISIPHTTSSMSWIASIQSNARGLEAKGRHQFSPSLIGLLTRTWILFILDNREDHSNDIAENSRMDLSHTCVCMSSMSMADFKTLGSPYLVLPSVAGLRADFPGHPRSLKTRRKHQTSPDPIFTTTASG